MEDDEALIASGHLPLFWWDIVGLRIPLMIMTYVGAFKSWLYAPILAVGGASIASLRIPAILIGGTTILLSYQLLRITNGLAVAATSAILLCFDTSFLLTTCFDWGPVALQHLLMVCGLLLLVLFHFRRNRRNLFLAFLCFGLGFWDKALFAWTFSGIVAAGTVVFWKEVHEALSIRNMGIALSALALGAAPLIAYNIAYPLNTYHSNASFSWDWKTIALKTRHLTYTMSGEELFDNLVS